jgi:2-polyprenyl-3-methyl-5-hydroxy-6-metoxy-1,4-benzoquinol methylase
LDISVKSNPAAVVEFDANFIRGVVERLLPGGHDVEAITRRGDLPSREQVAVYVCKTAARSYLLKTAPADGLAPSPELNSLLLQRSPGCFRVPRLYGTTVADGARFELWEYVSGWSKPFKDYNDQELEGLLRAIATSDAEACTLDGVRRTYWLKPVAGVLQKAISTRFSQFSEEIQQFSVREQRLLERTGTLGADCITHNDLHAHNVIVSLGDYYLIDWESASRGPAGATLRAFIDWPDERARWVANTYVAFSSEFGIHRNVYDVLFAMRVHQAYMRLRTGVTLRKVERIASGLNHFRLLEMQLTRRGTMAIKPAVKEAKPVPKAAQPGAGAPKPAPKKYKPASKELMEQVREFMAQNRGKLYHKIPHPDFAGLPASHDGRRFDIIKPHLAFPGGTVLDIGTHWGQLAHWLEDQGYRVTAVERSRKHAAIARGIRDICDKKFEVVEGSIFDISPLKYDIVLALNIFHHFLKTKPAFDSLVDLLTRIDCKIMFFEAHVQEEDQMKDAFVNFSAEDFVRFIANTGKFSKFEQIGVEVKRKIFKLTK